MPICTDESFQLKDEDKSEVFRDNEMVFCCHSTNRIFRKYDEYFNHTISLNSIIWKCEKTGRGGLTYEEALMSEKNADRHKLKDCLKAPVLLTIEATKQTTLKKLHLIAMRVVRQRFFLGEKVLAGPKHNIKYKVSEIIPPKDEKLKEDGTYDPSKYTYRLTPLCPPKKHNGDNTGGEIMATFADIRRKASDLTIERLRKFVVEHTIRKDGVWVPNSGCYKKYVLEPGHTFAKLFHGNVPQFPQNFESLRSIAQKAKNSPPASTTVKKTTKKPTPKTSTSKTSTASTSKTAKKRKRSPTPSKSASSSPPKQTNPPSLTPAEKRAKLWERIDAECVTLLEKTDDLERDDQRMLPAFTSIQAYLPSQRLGGAFMLLEFMQTFAELLSGIEVFKPRITLSEVTRAYSRREVVGPLSDIMLVLLGTIFDLQKEEEEECAVDYIYGGAQWRKLPASQRAMSEATACHSFARRHFSFKINELPLDALTLSEVLRLHILSSGALTRERTDKWRTIYRNGYSSREDPGLIFRLNNGRILRKLRTQPLYNLRFDEIMQVIECLVAQILTYSSTIGNIEERMEELAQARAELKTQLLQENRRVNAVETERRKLNNAHNQACMDEAVKRDAAQKSVLSEKLNKKVAELLTVSSREQRKYEEKVADLNAVLFNGLICLGSDRAHRRYFILESVPGILVEHAPDVSELETCLATPPVNRPQSKIHNMNELPRNRRDLRSYLMKLYTEEAKQKSKSLLVKSTKEDKENLDTQTDPETIAVKLPIVENGLKDTPTATTWGIEQPTQTELFMCTGNAETCLVHNSQQPQRQRWAYIYKEADIDALIERLNPLGQRESELRDQLKTMRDFVLNHVKTCPASALSLQDEESREKFEQTMLLETSRKYAKPNFGLDSESDMNEVIGFHLIGRLLQFEHDIYTGDLGELKVDDMVKWRKDLLDGQYDPQGTLDWGGVFNVAKASGNAKVNGSVSRASSTTGDDNASVASSDSVKGSGTFTVRPYQPPGETVEDTYTVGSDSGSDEEKTTEENAEELQCRVRKMASALLQIEQAIGRKFLKEPFGVTKKEHKELLELKLSQCAERLQQWEVSLMESTSFSQVLLHLNILHDCIIWARSTTRSLCIICRRGTDAEKMLLCDECNSGTHMFCMKPKLKTVPEGNWYCRRCVKDFGFKNEEQKKVQRKRKPKFNIEEEEEEVVLEDVEEEPQEVFIDEENGEALEEEEAQESDDGGSSKEQEENDSDKDANEAEAEKQGEVRRSRRTRIKIKPADAADYEEVMENETEEEGVNLCSICKFDGSDVWCGRCAKAYHLECVNLRRVPRGEYVCEPCRQGERTKRRRRNEDVDDSDFGSENYRPATKRGRLHLVTDDDDDDDDEDDDEGDADYSSTRRTTQRRTHGNLPLNNVLLYKLLESAMKNESAWPFLRPVSHSEVPDYHEIVKKPMDLATIKHKLNIGQYQLNEEVLNEIQLVFHNCFLYNDEGTEIYNAGQNLERFVMEKCRELDVKYKPSELNSYT